MNFEIGQVIEKENYTAAAIWCNQNGAHIEKQDGQYVIVENLPAPIPSAEEQVQAKEAETGLTRAVREMVLAENSGVSDFVRQQAQEIENMALPLREDNKI